jgi:Ca-activated chloride channel family protein
MLHLRRVSFALLFLLLALSVATLAQSGRKPSGQGNAAKGEADDVAVRVKTEEVILPITVRDSRGRLVRGLEARDFFIYDNGQRQEIENFNRRQVPVNVIFVLDASGSVFERMDVIRQAAISFVKTLAPEDRVAILQFADKVQWLQDWTGNFDEIQHTLNWKYRPGQATAFYDALAAAAEKFQGIAERRAIILLTDGVNTKGQAGFAQALAALQRAEATVYVVSETEAQARLLRRDAKGAAGVLNRIFGGAHQAQVQQYLALLENAERELTALADTTGGRIYFPVADRDLARAYAEVAEELKTQYIVTYVPAGERAADGVYHKVEVLVRGIGYQAHTRRGYYKTSNPD